MVKEAHTGTMKILVVHRQNTTVDQIKSVLSNCNPVVLYAESGLDGLLTSRIEHFDVIICGTDLPVVTGFELVRSVRTNSVNRNTPVVFLSDEVSEKSMQLGKSLGIAAQLTMRELESRLPEIVKKQVVAEADKVWINLQTGLRKE